MTKRAFTLIELLIVVAIIAILAAIAVPNFLEAQVRSKVSRVKADQRTVATAMEAYAVDYNRYPPNDGGGVGSQFRLGRFSVVTTPVSYITSFPKDVFLPGDRVSPGAALDGYQYFNFDRRYDGTGNPQWVSWGYAVRNDSSTFDIKGGCIKSWGPDAGKGVLNVLAPGDDGIEWAVFGLDKPAPSSSGFVGIRRFYDPSNGTISAGDIARFIGESPITQVTN